jgi:hypothetical protein
MTTFDRGDRVRWNTTDDDGLPTSRYGFVGGRVDRNGRVVVMLDGHLRGDVVVLVTQLELVSVTTVTLHLDGGSDLLDDPSLRQGLVALWQAEAEEAGLHVEDVRRLGTGVRDAAGLGFALAEIMTAGQLYVLRACADSDAVCVRADEARRFERPVR